MEGFTYPERPEGYNYSKELILLEAFDKYIKNNDISLPSTWGNKAYREIIQEMIFSIYTAGEEKLTVIPTMMGLGKSTLLFFLVKVFANIYKNFGCIIVKERVKDVLKFEEDFIGEIDKYGDSDRRDEMITGYYGYSEIYCLKGIKEDDYKKGKCSACNESSCKVKVSKEKIYRSPIIIITHARLKNYVQRDGDIKQLKFWIDEKGNKQERKLLLIDEKPVFFDAYKINISTIETFYNALRDYAENTEADIKYDIIKDRAYDMAKQINEIEMKPTDNEDVLIELNKIKINWLNKSSTNNDELFKGYYNFFLNGAIKRDNNLYTYERLNYQFKGFRTIIFDGTAKNDMIYPENKIIADIDDFRDYSNVTIYHNDQKNFSKYNLNNQSSRKTVEEKFEVLANKIIEISKNEKTFVLCYKEHEEKLKELLGENENIYINHYNNIKGSNDYNECTNIFFAGTMDYGDEYYILKSIAINPSAITTLETKNESNKHIFECDFINQVEKNTKIIDLLQEIFRISIRNFKSNDKEKKQINIYIYQTDLSLIEELQSYLEGSSYIRWDIQEFREEVAPTEARVIKYILANLKNVGDKVTKSEIDEACDVSSEYRKRIMRNVPFKNAMAENGIVVRNKYIEKVSNYRISVSEED